MTDKQIIAWIEDEVSRCLGGGDWHHVMYDIHKAAFEGKEVSLRKAVENRLTNQISRQDKSRTLGNRRVSIEIR